MCRENDPPLDTEQIRAYLAHECFSKKIEEDRHRAVWIFWIFWFWQNIINRNKGLGSHKLK